VSENRVLRRIFGPKRDEVKWECRKLHNESLMICTSHPILLGDELEKNGMGGTCSAYWGEERRVQSFGGEI
jgi:hypothetical protein